MSPSMDNERGIQIVDPKQEVIRSAILVFPLPGSTNRKHAAPGIDGGAETVETSAD